MMRAPEWKTRFESDYGYSIPINRLIRMIVELDDRVLLLAYEVGGSRGTPHQNREIYCYARPGGELLWQVEPSYWHDHDRDGVPWGGKPIEGDDIGIITMELLIADPAGEPIRIVTDMYKNTHWESEQRYRWVMQEYFALKDGRLVDKSEITEDNFDRRLPGVDGRRGPNNVAIWHARLDEPFDPGKHRILVTNNYNHYYYLDPDTGKLDLIMQDKNWK